MKPFNGARVKILFCLKWNVFNSQSSLVVNVLAFFVKLQQSFGAKFTDIGATEKVIIIKLCNNNLVKIMN